MVLNLLINYCVLKELMCEDKCKKIQLKLKHRKDRSDRSGNIAIVTFVTEKLEWEKK